MKKTIIHIISLVLALCAVFCVGAGCKEEEKTSAKVENTAPEGYQTLMKFDSWREMQLCHYSSNYGAVKINTDDETYIREGAASIKIEPVGDIERQIMPKITIDTDSEYFLTDDFTVYEAVEFDVFNTSDETSGVMIYLGIVVAGGVVSTLPVPYDLPAKQWTRVSYDFTSGAFYEAFDLSKVRNVYIAFPDYRTSVEKPSKILYMDNMIGKLKQRDYELTSVNRGANEIMDFEDPVDTSLLRYIDGALAEITANPAYVTSGTYALQLSGTCNATVKLSTIANRLAAADKGISIDVIHADSGAMVFNIEALYFNNETREYSAAVVTVSVKSNESMTVVFDQSLMPAGYGLQDIEYIRFSGNASRMWIDNLQIIRG